MERERERDKGKGEKVRKRKGEKEIVLGYYTRVTYKVQKQHEKSDKKVGPQVNRLISKDL